MTIRVLVTDAAIAALDIGDSGYSYSEIQIDAREGRYNVLIGPREAFRHLLAQAETHIDAGKEWDVTPSQKVATKNMIVAIRDALKGSDLQ